MNNKEVHDRLAEYIRTHAGDSFQAIAGRLGVAYSTVSRVAKAHGLSRSRRPEHVKLPELKKEKNDES